MWPAPSPYSGRRQVQDLLGGAAGSAKGFLAEDQSLGFKNVAELLTVPPVIAEQYSAAATGLAAELVKNIATLAPCAAAATGAAEIGCAESFIRSFGKRAFRRPLAVDEVAVYSKLFQGERARSSYSSGIGLIAETMLQSPNFVYRTEIGNGQGVDRKLTPYEIASQISYLVTGSMPDPDLFAVADAGKLGTPDEIEAQVRRLLTTARAKTWLRGFVQEWLDLGRLADVNKNPTMFPSFDQTLRPAIAQEAEGFIDAVLTEANGSLTALFGASWSYVNATLARHYGVARVPAGTAAQRIELPSDQRAGILTQVAFLATHSKPDESFPIARGKALRTRILCRDLPPPPPDMMIAVPKASTTLTTRERFTQHSSVQPCLGCHRLIDGLGFGFENYDAVGAFRTSENGKPVDASGEIVGVSPELDGPFRGAVEFVRKVSTSQTLRACAAVQTFRWAMGRRESSDEVCGLEASAGRLNPAAPDLRELLVAHARSDAFVLRTDR